MKKEESEYYIYHGREESNKDIFDKSDARDEGSSDNKSGDPSEVETTKIFQHTLDRFSDHQLIAFVNEKETEYRHLRLENQIFCGFLQDQDPAELEGLENLVSFATQLVATKTDSIHSSQKLAPPIQDVVRMSVCSVRHSIRYESFSSINSVLEGRGPRINLSQKSEMALKAIEEIQTNLEVFLKKCRRITRNLKADLEESVLREKDIRESLDSFEFNVVVQGVDPLTQRIPAEKFIRWMEEWQKSAQLNIEKLRLRTATLKIHLKKVSATLVQRQELGENVHAVDFDQLEIENKHFSEKLELKNIQLVELKRMSGGASLVLNNNKKNLRILQNQYNILKAQVADKEKRIGESEKQCEKIEVELGKAKIRYNSFKKLTLNYKVPDMMEYVNIKAQLNEVRKEIKVWHRRKKIQDITINACLRQMKNITGSSKINRAWFENMPMEETIDSIDLEYDHIYDGEEEEELSDISCR